MDNDNLTEKFVPKGAMTFFVLLLGLMIIIWFSIYFILIN